MGLLVVRRGENNTIYRRLCSNRAREAWGLAGLIFMDHGYLIKHFNRSWSFTFDQTCIFIPTLLHTLIPPQVTTQGQLKPLLMLVPKNMSAR